MKATIVGCGVSGLTCGIRLIENGFDVTLYADHLPPDTTSNVAAAIWLPFKVSPQERVTPWALTSYHEFQKITASIPEAGVHQVHVKEYSREPASKPIWADEIDNFHQLDESELPAGYVDGFSMDVPVIETPEYMKYLMHRFTVELGGTIVHLEQPITSFAPLFESTHIVVNCTGLAAGELCADSAVFPIRGQIVRTTNPGITDSFFDETPGPNVTYVVARNNDCVIGGTAQENNWDLNVDPQTADDIISHSSAIEMGLKDAVVLEHKVGLRPGRTEVRLEKERVGEDQVLIHNYGHGGAGFTLSWGCADEVVSLAKGL